MIVLPQAAFVPGQVVCYEAAARIACESLGVNPDIPMPVLPHGWEMFGRQQLTQIQDYGGVKLTLTEPTGTKIMMPAWQVMARYIEINRAVLFALQQTGCPSTIIPGN